MIQKFIKILFLLKKDLKCKQDKNCELSCKIGFIINEYSSFFCLKNSSFDT